jgi:hypothetical protein
LAQVVSAIHLRILPRERLPVRIEWVRIPYLNGFSKKDMGGVFLIGKTQTLDEIYILAYSPSLGDLVRKTAASAWQLMKTVSGEMIMVDCAKNAQATPITLNPNAPNFEESYFSMVRLVGEVEGGTYT